MKTTTILHRSNWASFLVVLVVSFFTTVQVQAQGMSPVDIFHDQYLEQVNNLTESWDKSTYNMYVQSRVNAQSSAVKESGPSTFAVYSFEGNVETAPNIRVADNRLKKLASLLGNATDEISEVSKQKNYEGELNQLKPLLEFFVFSVSNQPLAIQKLDVSRKVLSTLKEEDLEQSTAKLEALSLVAEDLVLFSVSANKKHLAYKFLAASVLTIPAVWTYLEPEFTRLAREGGATTDNLQFAKLYMDRLPYFEDDSRIWKEAPRFYASQLKLSKPAIMTLNGQISRVELSDTETKVTVTYLVSNHENWFRFDENIALVDSKTKHRYSVKAIEDKIPLGKTVVLVGCGGRCVDFTFVFPPVKQSMESFYLDESDPAPSSESARKAYNKKHNIMSDGSGTLRRSVYKLSDYVH